jgi:hypothetical protein
MVQVPWLLANEVPANLVEYWPRVLPPDWLECGRDFQFSFLPVGFCSKLIARMYLVQSLEFLCIWRDGFVVRTISDATCRPLLTAACAHVYFSPSTHTLSIRVRQYAFSSKLRDRALLLTNIIDAVNTIIECFFPAASTTMECTVPCSHCLATSGRYQTTHAHAHRTRALINAAEFWSTEQRRHSNSRWNKCTRQSISNRHSSIAVTPESHHGIVLPTATHLYRVLSLYVTVLCVF